MTGSISKLVAGFILATFAWAANSQDETPQVYRESIEPHWFADGTRFWYRNDQPGGGREFIFVDCATGDRKPAFDHAAVAKAMEEELGKKVRADQLPVESLEIDEFTEFIRLKGKGRYWIFEPESGTLAGPVQVDRLLDKGREERPSEKTGKEARIFFENTLDHEVEVFWIDRDGDRRSYGTVAPDETKSQHTYAGHVWLVLDRAKKCYGVFEAEFPAGFAMIGPPAFDLEEEKRKPEKKKQPRKEVVSPDKKWAARVKDHNLWIRNLADDSEHQLSNDATGKHSFHRDAIESRAIRMSYNKPDYPPTLPEVYWSPDSRKLLALQTRVVPEPRVHLVEAAPKDQDQPKHHSYPYLKAGDPIPEQTPRLFDVEELEEIPFDRGLIEKPWRISEFQWERDSSRVTFTFNQRGHQIFRMLSLDANSGELTTIINEESPSFIDYSRKKFLWRMDEDRELIWMSERDGWNHLYLYDSHTGEVKNQITKGEWVVRGVEKVDRKKRRIWFRAGGIRKGQDPYFIHYCTIDFDGSNLVVLTEGDGNHTIQWSPKRRWFIDTWSRADHPPVHELRSSDGAFLGILEEAHASELERAGYQFPEPFVAKGRDGKTDIYGVIHRPKNFDESKRYPVIENIYAGPHGAFVPKSFRAHYRHQQQIADRGFIVVQVDGMGTNWRSKKFHDVAWKNIGDAGFPDRIAWMKAAAKTRPWMDLSRVGIYGGSAGGQNAMRALIAHGDFYGVAVADCGCHDNRMDKIWWNEAWMGWPVGKHYEESSNVVQAHRLQGKLLLIVGALDRNVDPASTMQVADALVKADKDFELLVIPNTGHGAAETKYGGRRRLEWFERHLLGEGH